MHVLYALRRLTCADGMAVPFKLQGRGQILKMQPFQPLIHNKGLLVLSPVSSLSIECCPFRDKRFTGLYGSSHPVELQKVTNIQKIALSVSYICPCYASHVSQLRLLMDFTNGDGLREYPSYQ